MGVNEADAEGATTCLLELGMRFGMIYEEEKTAWSAGWDAPYRRMYVNGDRKSNENTESFNNKAQDRSLSLDEQAMNTETYIELIERTYFGAGDWHAGMNMMQTINKIYWDVLIDPVREMLGWQRVTKDCRACYYQCSKLTLFLNSYVYRYLWHRFVSDHWPKYKAVLTENNHENVITQIAVDFRSYIVDGYDDTVTADEHLRFICGFVLMSDIFRNFVDSYRGQDSIGIDHGYDQMAPAWKICGQNKYLQAWVEQLDSANNKFPYSRLQEYRMNRTVRTYPASTGKDAVAHDELVEIVN